MAKAEVLTGDQIAKQISTKSDSNFADIAREIHDMIDHKPQSYQAELAKINEALHAQHLLPGLDITGVQGSDFVAKSLSDRDASDHGVVRIDSMNLDHQKIGLPSTDDPINGRTAHLNPDGTGTVTVKAGDNPSFIARDVLKAQGNPDPSPREIANYALQLEQLNGKSKMHHLQPDMQLNLPPYLANTLKDGGDSSFLPERAKSAEEKTLAQIQSDHDAVWDAFKKNTTWTLGAGFNVTKNDIDRFLAPGSGISDKERQGFQFLKDHWATLSRGDKIWENEVTAYTQQTTQDVERDYELHKEG